MASCEVCGAHGARFCVPCRRKHGGKVLAIGPRPSSPRRRRRAKPHAAAPRRRRAAPSSSSPRKSKHLSKEAFKRRMRAGKLKAERARRARGGR